MVRLHPGGVLKAIMKTEDGLVTEERCEAYEYLLDEIDFAQGACLRDLFTMLGNSSDLQRMFNRKYLPAAIEFMQNNDRARQESEPAWKYHAIEISYDGIWDGDCFQVWQIPSLFVQASRVDIPDGAADFYCADFIPAHMLLDCPLKIEKTIRIKSKYPGVEIQVAPTPVSLGNLIEGVLHGLYYACENEENAFLNMISQIQEDDWSDGMTLEEFKSDLDGYLGNK